MTTRRRHRRSSKDNTSKNVISVVISFVLSIVGAMLGCLLAVYFGFFNTNHIITSFNKVDYYSRVTKNFEEKAWEITMPLGLPKEVLDGVADINKVSRDVKGDLSAGLDQSDYTVNTADLKETLAANVREHFQKENMELDENQEQVLTEYQTAIEAEYISNVGIPLIRYFGYAKSLYTKVMAAGIPVCIFLIVSAITLLVKLRQWKHRGVRYVSYGTLGSMLMTGGIPLVLLVTGAYKKLQMSPDYFYDFIMQYIKGGLSMFLYIALTWGLISLMLIYLVGKLMKKSKRRR